VGCGKIRAQGGQGTKKGADPEFRPGRASVDTRFRSAPLNAVEPFYRNGGPPFQRKTRNPPWPRGAARDHEELDPRSSRFCRRPISTAKMFLRSRAGLDYASLRLSRRDLRGAPIARPPPPRVEFMHISNRRPRSLDSRNASEPDKKISFT